MNPVLIFVGVFALVIVWLVIVSKKAGPRTVSDIALARGRVLVRISVDEPNRVWDHLGSMTVAEGLNLKFGHDDDPAAEAVLNAPRGGCKIPNTRFGNHVTITLSDLFETHHVHTSGHAFQVRLCGTGEVIGREVRLKMTVGNDKSPVCGTIENDDDTQAAVGDWIEIEFAEILSVPPGA